MIISGVRIYNWTDGNWVQYEEELANDSAGDCGLNYPAYENFICNNLVHLNAAGNRLAYGNRQGDYFSIYDLIGEDWVQVNHLQVEWGYLRSLSMSSNGNHLAVLGDTIIRVYGFENILAAELIAFDALTQSRSIRLSWQTASELNNQGFEIQRSKNGINWEKIAWQAGSGTTNSLQDYEYNDTNPQLGVNYYRLKQVDYDGNFEYSHIVSAKYNIDSDIRVSPVPAKDVLYIEFDVQGATVLKIVDITGRIIRTENITVTGFYSKALDIKNLARGTYFITIENGENAQTQKFVKQ